jgi:hypothetical protein
VSTLRYVSSPVALTLQSYYSAASSGFTTYGARPDGTQPAGTAWRQSITLAASDINVVDIDACTWLASWITAYAGDPLLSQVAIVGPAPDNAANVIPIVLG